MRAITLSDILCVVSEEMGVEYEDLIGRRRGPAVSMARRLFVFFARRWTTCTYQEIGAAIERSRVTCSGIERCLLRRLRYDQPVADQVERIRIRLKEAAA